MFSGIYRAGSGMTGQMQNQEVLARNLAGSSLPGFKAQRLAAGSFAAALKTGAADSDAAPGGSAEIFTDFSPSAIRQTGRPLDFAIGGNGFFSVRTDANEVLYTRNGSFHLDPDGTLSTAEGHRVLGTGGPLRLAADDQPETLRVKGDGTLLVGKPGAEREIGRLALVMPADPNRLQRMSANYYTAPQDLGLQPAAKAEVHGRSLEAANVSPIEEMARMVQSLREFETSQQLLRMQSDLVRDEQQKVMS